MLVNTAEIIWADGRTEVIPDIDSAIGFGKMLSQRRASAADTDGGLEYREVVIRGKTFTPEDVEKVIEADIRYHKIVDEYFCGCND